MTYAEVFANRLMAGGRHSCIALAAACGDRMLRVYNEYWVGDHFEAPATALEYGWAGAAGVGVDASLIRSCHTEVESIANYYYEEGIELLAEVVTISLRVLEGIIEEETKGAALAAARACDSALFAARLVDVKICGQDRVGAVAEPEESEWQAKAIALAVAQTGTVQRDQFSRLGTTPPSWWAVYKAAPTHL